MTARTLVQLLDDAARRWPESEVVFPDERATLPELDARARHFARLLLAAGVERGDHVGILLTPSVDFVAALFGIVRVGGVVVPVNERFKARELRYVAVHGDLRVLITTTRELEHPDFPTLLTEALPELASQPPGPLGLADAPRLGWIVLLNTGEAPPGFTLPAELGEPTAAIGPRARAPRHPPDRALDELAAAVGPEAFAFVMYTSGTSADPKGCLIPHRAVVHQGWALAETRYFLGPDDTFWCPLPLFHNGGLATLMACLSSGATYCHAGRFEPERSLRQLGEERCTHAIPAFETIWLRVLDHPAFPRTDISRLRIVLNAGTRERLRQLQERLPDVVQLANYGMTEATGHLSMTLPTDSLEVRLTTGGHPLPGMEARVVDPDSGRDREPGVEGEILFRGVMRFHSYYKSPVLTAEAIDADGWFRSGDLGILDADGRLTYTGRLKDMLKVGGENVAATEVEAFLLQNPAVNIVQVVGVPDARYVEVPAAFVELAPDAEVTEQELIDFCLGRIATFKVPRYVRFVDEWPMSGTKVKKFLLREQLVRELEEQGITEAPRLRSGPP